MRVWLSLFLAHGALLRGWLLLRFVGACATGSASVTALAFS